jgi:hypothetical protein
VTLDVTDYVLRKRGIDMWARVRSKLRMRPKEPQEDKKEAKGKERKKK